MSAAARRLSLGAALAAGAVLAITGCSATTGGTAAGPATGTGCAASGYSAAAATATVRCYLDALRAGDTDTACEQLSAHARAEVVASVRENQLQGLINTSTPGRSLRCATVAIVIQRVLDSLAPAQRAELNHQLSTAKVGAVQLSGSSATVEVRISGRDTTRPTLVRGPVTWRIDSMPGTA